MNPCSLPLFILSTFLLSFFFINGANGDSNLVTKVCRVSIERDPNLNYTFCLESFQAVPNSQNATLRGLGFISVKLTHYNTVRVHALIKELLNQNSDNKSRGRLQDCSSVYSGAVYDTRDAFLAFRSGDYQSANVHVSAAMDASKVCEDGFAMSTEGARPPLGNNNKEIFGLSAVALFIINMLAK
ncbi:putative invertase inhibitor [Malania oleifera]|uniref:putative invertase inhibitor n=1 Tax=Malania oleifera TaxID=397392 RepID=UPI0025AE72B4|nr:putative invertase inhibitor [Malania oleifera]